MKYLLRKFKFLYWLISYSSNNHWIPTGFLRHILLCHSSAQNLRKASYLPVKSYDNLQSLWSLSTSWPSLPDTFPLFAWPEAYRPLAIKHASYSPSLELYSSSLRILFLQIFPWLVHHSFGSLLKCHLVPTGPPNPSRSNNTHTLSTSPIP